jgi:hypothetical protein
MADINMDDDAAGPRRPISLPILTKFLDSLQSYSQDLVQHLQSGAALCHYTTLEGLYGIIVSGDLWLTNSRYCNDNEELKYGNRVVEAVLTELQGEAESNEPQLDWLQNLRAEFRAAREDEAYICCFCEKQNLLSQWRGYADDGGGVGIEFDAEGFRNFAGPDSPFGLMRLWKVFYSKTQQRDIVRKAIEYPYWPTPSPQDRIYWIVDALKFFVPTFKNEGFHEEQERRLIFTPGAGIATKQKFRTRRGLLVPYFSLRELFEVAGFAGGVKLPILNILVGPSANKSLNVESIKMMLETNGYYGVGVKASPIPFRG